jgi:acyl-CoA dehydrogenase
MELLEMFATPAQRAKWLEPLLAGELRSAFAMTEPDVASSDATNIAMTIERAGNEYVINGRKWWTTGVCDPRCGLIIVMGKTNPKAEVHNQQSMVLVPMNTPGLRVVRPLPVLATGINMGMANWSLSMFGCPLRTYLVKKGLALLLPKRDWGPGACITACGLSVWLKEHLI